MGVIGGARYPLLSESSSSTSSEVNPSPSFSSITESKSVISILFNSDCVPSL
uniref:Uncharacterized protein n=1 Tax=Lepeophtheirus salmonis TaxID=72036 RepID=A0A0K2T0V3_LEPSM